VQIYFSFAYDDNRHLREQARCRQEFRQRFRMNNRGARLAIFQVMNVIEERAKGFTGTATAPIFAAPKNVAMNSAESGSTIRTRSPRETPCARNAFPARFASAASSP